MMSGIECVQYAFLYAGMTLWTVWMRYNWREVYDI